uniref:Uncharacterized protein n=1 Tax=Brassica oleracea TaxID=3712 RepID=A0A3P6HB08_BRAOL|nr:unnamed protein product [Brassica oleracea]
MGLLQWFVQLFFFINFYYSRYVMVRGYLDYKIKPDFRTRFNK